MINKLDVSSQVVGSSLLTVGLVAPFVGVHAHSE